MVLCHPTPYQHFNQSLQVQLVKPQIQRPRRTRTPTQHTQAHTHTHTYNTHTHTHTHTQSPVTNLALPNPSPHLQPALHQTMSNKQTASTLFGCLILHTLGRVLLVEPKSKLFFVFLGSNVENFLRVKKRSLCGIAPATRQVVPRISPWRLFPTNVVHTSWVLCLFSCNVCVPTGACYGKDTFCPSPRERNIENNKLSFWVWPLLADSERFSAASLKRRGTAGGGSSHVSCPAAPTPTAAAHTGCGPPASGLWFQ